MTYENTYTQGRTSTYCINYQIVWGTNLPLDISDDDKLNIKSIFESIGDENGYSVTAVEFVDDYVVINICSHPKYSITQIVKQLKGTSVLKIRCMMPEHYEFSDGTIWNRKYFVETIGSDNTTELQRFLRQNKRQMRKQNK